MAHTYKVLLSYCGEKYFGYQIQKNGDTIQNEIQKALLQYLQSEVKIVASGRTDSGVHARGQVFHFKSPRLLDPRKLPDILNFYLPRDIFIKKAFLKEEEFHSRLEAKVRHYRYRLVDSNWQERDRLDASNYLYGKIDLKKLLAYLKIFEGIHDFSTFCSSKDVNKNKIREIFKIDAYRLDGEEIIIDLYGNAFLMNMVRKIIGSALYAYRREKSLSYLQELLLKKNPKEAKHLAQAKGLCLQGVYYSPVFGQRGYYER